MTDTQSLKQRASEVIDSIAPDLVEVSHRIHERPELNFEEYFASELLCQVATRHGLAAERNVYGTETGFVAEAGRSADGPLVCVMSEYDALPDIGHGCGHNVIAAAGLGASIALAAVADEAGGRLRYLGTPAEEGGGGKIVMADNGALDGVQLAMMVHSADADLLQIDAIALQQLIVRYHGAEAHAAAAPHMGRNALDAAVLGYMAVAALRQHIQSSERVHGIFTAAGEKPNIVPRVAASEWYVRSDTLASLEDLKDRVLNALRSGAMATGCTCDHTWVGHPYADLITNNAAAEAYARNASTLGRTVTDPRVGGRRVVGSTDMGNVSHLVPTIHPMIQSAPSGSVIHTAQFAELSRQAMADRAVLDGARAMAHTVIDYWVDSSLRASVQQEFAASRPGL